MKYSITKLSKFLEEFCEIYKEWERNNRIGYVKKRHREGKMSLKDMLLVVIIFHYAGFMTFKHYYLFGVQQIYRKYFGDIVSYARFVYLKPRLILPLCILFHMLKGKKTGLYFVDSTKMIVSHNKRTGSHKVFKELANMGMSSYGWFYGFKLHMIINEHMQIVAVKITKANVDDRKGLKGIINGFEGFVYGDKGYVGAEIFDFLKNKGITLITKIKRNMTNKLISLSHKMNLRRRSIIESAFNVLKNNMHMEHTRHRSPFNFIVNTISALIAYNFIRCNKRFNYQIGDIL